MAAGRRRVLPPGTILQHMYVRRRLRRRAPGRFVEVGTGEGDLARMLIEQGWTGVGYEPGPGAEVARGVEAVGGFELRATDWLDEHDPPRADLFVSAMVLEHLAGDDVRRFLEQASRSIGADGVGIVLVPGSPRHWGVEDEVAGHVRRYTREALAASLEVAGLEVTHMAGLTWPLSNLLLPLSNSRVLEAEGGLRELTARERTLASGSRDVPWKTRFPAPARIVLNEAALLPFYGLQLLARRNEDALVLYAEWRRAAI